IIGAEKYAIPAKPVPQFLAAWQQILETVSRQPEKPLIIAIIGGGAGGVELALNMQSRLHTILKEAGQTLEKISLHIFHRDRQLLPHHNPWVSRRLKEILLAKGIVLHLQENVKKISNNLAAKDCHQIICDSGLEIAANNSIRVTQASAPSWLKASGLATDSQGFILIRNTLQTKSHSHIFAAGDI
ncbi:MAG: FAD-dependent oxidoreductase, partial [Snowella sp.]